MSEMNATEQKVVFLSLLRSIFKDKSRSGLTEENCIGFYHYLIERLEQDIELYINIENEEKFYFFETVIKILKEFDTYDYRTLQELNMSHRRAINFLLNHVPVKIQAPRVEVITKSLRFKYACYKQEFMKQNG